MSGYIQDRVIDLLPDDEEAGRHPGPPQAFDAEELKAELCEVVNQTDPDTAA